MLIDLLNSSNYIMVNRDAIRIFGLNTAVYCAELLNIYKKAIDKNKLINEIYFKVDRKYITKQTTLEVEDQLKCDKGLVKTNILKVDPTDPDVVSIDVETFASILSCEDIKIIDAVANQVQAKSATKMSATKRDRIILRLKEDIQCKDYNLMISLRDWIDSIMTNPNKYVSKQQVELFTEALTKYCGSDMKKALDIVKIATVHQYVDCQWAINLYEKEKIGSSDRKTSSIGVLRSTTPKKITTTQNIGDEIF